jgi:hypothetical protein
MNYLMLVCAGRQGPTDEAGPTIDEWLAEVEGKRLEGEALDVLDATTVRARGDEILVTDGPFAETREVVGGYDIIDCADLDEAIRIASRHPVARFGAIELRPIPNGSDLVASPDPVGHKYMMLVCVDPDAGPEGRGPECHVWGDELGAKNLLSAYLGSTDDATTVRTRGHEVLLTDGPFAETREYIAGFTVADCADHDEAIALASRHPAVRHGAVEIRPFPKE